MRARLKRVLGGAGYRVQAAANGAEALELAQTTPPDLVLLGLRLPDKSGWEVFKGLIKEKPLLPVVIITGKANQLFTALAAGVAALLEKPLRLPHLLRTIRRLLAESAEIRLARHAGKPARFYYSGLTQPTIGASSLANP